MISLLERGHRMAAKHGPAIQGAGGDSHTHRLMDGLNGLGLSESEAWTVADLWNATCDPPWSHSALKAKIQSAFKHTDRRGRLLKEDDERRWQHTVQSVSAHRASRSEASEPWPNIGIANGGTLARLAKLRGLSPEVMADAQLYGYLRFGWRYGHQCYVLLDERESFAQYRRMDGGMFHHGQKSDNLARRKTRPIGLRHLGGRDVPVFLTEGTVGYLELLELLHRADMSHCTAALTLPSAASSTPSDVLPMLAGRRVRIIGDTGRAGEQATSRWVRELQSVGANVDCVDLSRVPELARVPKADLGDLLKLPQTPTVLQTITAITSL